MTKYPKKLLKAVMYYKEGVLFCGHESAYGILERLQETGYLKLPPQPREIWWCQSCNSILKYPGDHAAHCKGERILMREVIE